MEYQEISEKIIRAAFNVHNSLGAGFLEKVYHNSMIIELQEMGLVFQSEIPIPVFYKQVQVGEYYADIFVEDCILVELKAVDQLHSAHEAQLVSYLVGTMTDVGLLINFGKSVHVKRKYRRRDIDT